MDLKTILLNLLNIVILQWFFIRIVKCDEEVIESYRLMSIDMMMGDNMACRGHGTIVKYQWYSLVYFIVPLTSWGNKFYSLYNEPTYKKLTKKYKL